MRLTARRYQAATETIPVAMAVAAGGDSV